MKRVCVFTILLCLIGFSAHARSVNVVVGGLPVTAAPPACADSSCTGFLVCQNFETTAETCTTCSEDNSETWTKSGGTITVDATSSAIRGSQYLSIDSGANGTGNISVSIAGTPTSGSLFFRYRSTDGTPTVQNRIFRIVTSEDTTLVTAYHRTDGNIRLYHGGNYQTSSGTELSADNTVRYIWVDFALGSGTDGTASVYVSANATKPASAAVSVTNGTALTSTPVTGLILRSGEDNGQFVHHYDQILFDNSTIGDVCD